MRNHSFAVLAYSESPYLSACLDSLKNQTMESDIYISTSTPSEYISAMAKKYRVDLFVTESGQGIAHDWNFSLRQAKTKYVTLAHQDDVYLPDYTASCIHKAEKFRDVLICFTNYSEIVEGKERSGTLLLRVKRLMLWFFMPLGKDIRRRYWKKKMLSAGCPIPAPSVMYNLEKLTGFQFSAEFSVNMDWDAWYRMAYMEGRFVYVNKMLLKHRIHSDSATTKGLEVNVRQREDLLMFKRFWPGFIARLLAKMYGRSYKSNKEVPT